MKQHKKKIVIAVVGVLLLGLLFFASYKLGQATNAVQVRIQPEGVTTARLVERDGVVLYEVVDADGKKSMMDPVAFAEGVWERHQNRSLSGTLMLRVLNISSTATLGWVMLGLFGQVLFAGRMIVQWIASEKAKASVIPTAFWWMALGGASMLLVYFFWRKDIVGIIGQTTGWMIYTRNLYFIYFNGKNKHKHEPESDEPSAEDSEAQPEPA